MCLNNFMKINPQKNPTTICSYFHHHGPSTSIASQSSLEIILEDGTIENGSMNCIHRLHKNRREYEQITDDDCDDHHHRHQHNQEPDELDGGTTSKRINGWRNVRAVMAYYYSLRKIKRNGAQFKYLLLLPPSLSLYIFTYI